jgi:hypothetical protein
MRHRQSGQQVDEKIFHNHFCSLPLVIATIWYNLCHNSIRDARILEKEKSEKGLLRLAENVSAIAKIAECPCCFFSPLSFV